MSVYLIMKTYADGVCFIFWLALSFRKVEPRPVLVFFVLMVVAVVQMKSNQLGARFSFFPNDAFGECPFMMRSSNLIGSWDYFFSLVIGRFFSLRSFHWQMKSLATNRRPVEHWWTRPLPWPNSLFNLLFSSVSHHVSS